MDDSRVKMIFTGHQQMYEWLAPHGKARGTRVLYDKYCPPNVLIGLSLDGRVAQIEWSGEPWKNNG